MKLSFFICLLFIAPFLGSAQKAQPVKQTTTANPAKAKKIKLLMETTGSGKLGVQMMDQMLSALKEQYPTVDKSFWDEFLKESKAEDIIELIIPVYDKYFTEADIDAMLVFYNTPVGKKTIATMPFIMKESMEIGEVWGTGIAEKVLAKLKAKGLIKN